MAKTLHLREETNVRHQGSPMGKRPLLGPAGGPRTYTGSYSQILLCVCLADPVLNDPPHSPWFLLTRVPDLRTGLLPGVGAETLSPLLSVKQSKSSPPGTSYCSQHWGRTSWPSPESPLAYFLQGRNWGSALRKQHRAPLGPPQPSDSPHCPGSPQSPISWTAALPGRDGLTRSRVSGPGTSR